MECTGEHEVMEQELSGERVLLKRVRARSGLFRHSHALLISKLPLIFIVASWKLYRE